MKFRISAAAIPGFIRVGAVTLGRFMLSPSRAGQIPRQARPLERPRGVLGRCRFPIGAAIVSNSQWPKRRSTVRSRDLALSATMAIGRPPKTGNPPGIIVEGHQQLPTLDPKRKLPSLPHSTAAITSRDSPQHSPRVSGE